MSPIHWEHRVKIVSFFVAERRLQEPFSEAMFAQRRVFRHLSLAAAAAKGRAAAVPELPEHYFSASETMGKQKRVYVLM